VYCRDKVSYVSRWRGGLAPLSSAAAATSASYTSSSGYFSSNCSDLLYCDSKTPLRLLDLQRRHRQRTCSSSDDVMRTMTSLNNVPTLAGDSQLQPSVKHELSSSLLVSSRYSLIIHGVESNTCKTRTGVIWQKAESPWQVYPTPRLHSPGGSIGRTAWLQFATACFGCASVPKSLLPLRDQGPPLTQCVIDPHTCTC